MKTLTLVVAFVVCGVSQESSTLPKSDLESQLKSANERIAQLELLVKQQQGLAQYFQAGQALCEWDKRDAGKPRDDHK